MPRGWNPWIDLRERHHLALEPRRPACGHAAYFPHGDYAVIMLDPGLTQVERNCALAHELIHDERGGGCDDHPDMTPGPAGWEGVARREERRVDDEAVRRLVPTAALRDFCFTRMFDLGEATGPAEVMEEFDVTWEYAERALVLLDKDGRKQQ